MTRVSVLFVLATLLAGGAESTQAQQFVISTVAGGAPPSTPAAGVSVPIGNVQGVATDAAGNVYFASFDLNTVFRLDQKGVLTRVAGNARRGYSGDGGPALDAQLWNPSGLAVDSTGNLFVAEGGRVCCRDASYFTVTARVVQANSARMRTASV